MGRKGRRRGRGSKQGKYCRKGRRPGRRDGRRRSKNGVSYDEVPEQKRKILRGRAVKLLL